MFPAMAQESDDLLNTPQHETESDVDDGLLDVPEEDEISSSSAAQPGSTAQSATAGLTPSNGCDGGIIQMEIGFPVNTNFSTLQQPSSNMQPVEASLAFAPLEVELNHNRLRFIVTFCSHVW